MGSFIINKSDLGKYYFVLRNNNNDIVLTGESFSAKENCLDSIELVKKSGLNIYRYERLTALDGSNFFYLRSCAGEVIGTSEFYIDVNKMEDNILYLRLNSNNAIIKDYPD